MSNRLDKDREKELQPKRMSYAIEQLDKLGLSAMAYGEATIKFEYNGNIITLYPYSGYYNGKGIKPGRGIKGLLDQLK